MLRVAEAVQRTDTGRQREANEDAYFVRAPVFAVADGMGGAQAGEVASGIAVEAFEPDRDDRIAPEDYLKATAREANRRIYDRAQTDAEHSGMGTTLTAALLRDDEVSFGHVGDSRAYVIRDGRMKQITNDHSLVEELRRQGKLTRDQAAEHPQRSVITRALGPEPDVAVDTVTVRARDGDVFLLCSDGLTTMLSDEDILGLVSGAPNLEEASRRLIAAANERGGRDNITVVLFRLESLDQEEVEEGATLVGPSAEAAGLTADAVREGVERDRAPEREREPVAAARSDAPSGRRWPRRLLAGVVTLAVLALIVGGAVIGARQVWFLGTNDAGEVALYRGLPYDLPFGISLYSEQESIPYTLAEIPEDRRANAVDHELRSHDDAVNLIDDLEAQGQQQSASTSPQPSSPAGGGKGGGGGAGAKGGGGSG